MLGPCRGGSTVVAGSSTSTSAAIVQLQEPMNLSSASDLGAAAAAAAFMFSGCPGAPQYQHPSSHHQHRDKNTSTRHTHPGRTGCSQVDELEPGGGMDTHLAALQSAAAWTAADECFRLEAARQLASLQSAVAGALQAQGGGGGGALTQVVGAHQQHRASLAPEPASESPLNLGGGQLIKSSHSSHTSNNNNNHNTGTPNHMGGQPTTNQHQRTSVGGLGTEPRSGCGGATEPAASRRGLQESRKCRKFYGVARRSLWCTQCRWKKACTRFWDPKSGTPPRAKSLRGCQSGRSTGCVVNSGEPLSDKRAGSQQQQQLHWIQHQQPLVHRRPAATQCGSSQQQQQQPSHHQQPQLRKCHRPHGSLAPELSLHLRQSS